MNKEEIQEASKILFEHRLNKTGLSSLKNLEPKTIDDAYKIQENLKLRYLELKDNICIGKKIGATSLTAQEVLNMDEPFYGNLFSRYSSVNPTKLYAKDFFEPYAEPEISFRIKEDIDISKAPYSIDDIEFLLDGLVCSIEINDFRFAKPLAEIGPRNVISTNGASEFWLRNEKIFKINDVNLNDLKVSLLIDEKLMDSGNTKNVLNNPLNAALWLINNLAKKGETLLKGQFISSGSCTKPSKIYSGNNIKAQFEQLGDIEFQFI
ncbi:hypothetical protein OA960_00405 [Pelagibacteraceae bacterium]|nr:hypothetical protein [Pelagibacteraceae bacterium]